MENKEEKRKELLDRLSYIHAGPLSEKFPDIAHYTGGMKDDGDINYKHCLTAPLSRLQEAVDYFRGTEHVLFGAPKDLEEEVPNKTLDKFVNTNGDEIKDNECCKPSLLPGDIVRSKKTGTLLVIVSAHTIINGCQIEWCDRLPDKIEHGWRPAYATMAIAEDSNEKFSAWSDIEEFEIIELGPVHNYLQ